MNVIIHRHVEDIPFGVAGSRVPEGPRTCNTEHDATPIHVSIPSCSSDPTNETSVSPVTERPQWPHHEG